MSKLTVNSITRDLREAKKRVKQDAIEQARKDVIAAKRAMCATGRTMAYVDCGYVQPIESRTDVRRAA